jgi:hypothetical protein
MALDDRGGHERVVDTISAERAIQGPVTTGFGSIWTVDIERDSVFRVAR